MARHGEVLLCVVVASALGLWACGDDDGGASGTGAGSGGTGGTGAVGGTGGSGGAGGTGGTGGTGGDSGTGGTGGDSGTGGTGGDSGTGGNDAVDPTPFAGAWTGGWENLTFASTGTATLSVTPDTTAKTVSFTLDLNGNVFGGSDPDAETFSGPYDADGYTVSGTSALFGTLTLNIDADGVITGGATPSRGATTLTGTATSSTMTINYAISDAPNDDILGVLTFTK